MEMIQITISFSVLFVIILFLLFSADKPNSKNLYLKKKV